MNFTEFSELITAWRGQNFRDALSALSGNSDSRALGAVERALEELGIAEATISAERLKGLAAREAGNPLALFSAAFNDTVLGPHDCDRSPVAYAVRWVERHNDYSNSRALTGYIARALRAMPSFMREEALASDIRDSIAAHGVNAEVVRDPVEDHKNHTDVLVRVSGRTYRIWTFVFSEQSFNRTAMKLAGALPAGIHVLCPLELERFARLESSFIALEKKRAVVAEMEQKYSQLECNATKRQLAKRVAGRQKTIELKRAEHVRLKEAMAGEVRFASGFFFYPLAIADQIAQIVSVSSQSVQQHSVPRAKVYDLLAYLRAINAFEVK